MYLSRDEMEAISERVLKAYEKLPSQAGGPMTAIDPEALASELLGIKVEYHRLSKYGSVLGLTVLGDTFIEVYDNDIPEMVPIDGKTVFIDDSFLADDANVGRRNFTIAHEISHQILCMLFPKAYQEAVMKRTVFCYAPGVMTRGNKSNWAEWQSNGLAALLLQPEHLVRGYMKLFGLGEKIPLLNRIFAPNEYEAFSLIAEKLGVSKSALHIRMKQLGVIERDYFENPYELVTVYKDDDEDDL